MFDALWNFWMTLIFIACVGGIIYKKHFPKNEPGEIVKKRVIAELAKRLLK